MAVIFSFLFYYEIKSSILFMLTNVFHSDGLYFFKFADSIMTNFRALGTTKIILVTVNFKMSS